MNGPVIFKDGALQGWVVSTLWTIVTMFLLVLGFVNKDVRDAWVAFGGNYATIYLGSMGVWFFYKGAKSFSGGGVNVGK